MPSSGPPPHISERSSSGAAAALPEFGRPPVVEVAISVQFDELAKFQPVHFGLLFERIRERYPRTEHHPPLGSVIELFEEHSSARMSLTMDTGFPTGRCWYLSQDGSELVQVQPDRFILNWRKRDTAADYPRYVALRQRFETELDTFVEFVSEHGLGVVQPLQCELTYVNHIQAGEGWQERHEVNRILSPWSGMTSEPYLPDIEDLRLAWHYRMDNGSQAPGRLHVQLQSAIHTDTKKRLFVLQLMGRGAPIVPSTAGALAFTDRAHEWIVRGFTSITTKEMHRYWERRS